LAAFYANENFPLPVVEELRRLGHDVLTSHDANQSDQAVPDEAVLDYAIAGGRAVLTLNRKHFIALHRQRGSHTGIVVCTVELIRVNRPSPP
jgi:Domain of unknown function (DUF5615)